MIPRFSGWELGDLSKYRLVPYTLILFGSGYPGSASETCTVQSLTMAVPHSATCTCHYYYYYFLTFSHGFQCSLDEATDSWGIRVERVEM